MKLSAKISFLTFILFFTGNVFHSFAQAPEVTGLTGIQFLKYPWAGGLNSCQFGQIDINLDGIPDLVIFDRQGSRVLPFIKKVGSHQSPVTNDDLSDYEYHPEMDTLFPDLHDWVIFADYNRDGKEDIFTYGLGGIRVFKNISDTRLRFQKITDDLTSFYYTGKVGILVTQVDYPAIADIDNDGDLDLLTFFGLGSYIEYHKNMSFENYGNYDSLDYRLSDKCWGDIRESEGSNVLTLNITCPFKKSPLPGISCSPGKSRHTGSTLLATDLDGNGVKDLVLGDIDFPDLISVINGGTVDSAHMISQDTLFPPNTTPVNLVSFPVMSLLDIDNDGIKDLVVSPFDAALTTANNYKSVWFYKNTGSDTIPVFQYMTDQFFQNEMIDVGSNAFPVLCDIDVDGLPDLLIGNYGYYDSSWYSFGSLYSSYISKIAWYKNTGTLLNPEFSLITDDFAGLSSLKLTGIYPAFGDVDGDGDFDLVTGNSDGRLIYLENTAGAGNFPVFAPPRMNYQDIDVGDFSTPQLFDLDRDGRPDLIIGERDGNLNYYHNDGPANNPDFTFKTDSLGKVNVTDYNLSYYGFSTPCLFHDNTGKTNLITGSEQGVIYYYINIDNDLEGKFTQSDSLYELVNNSPFRIHPGYRTSACIGKLTDPDYLDLLIGNYCGGVEYYSHKSIPHVIQTLEKPETRLRVRPNPADKEISVSFEGSIPSGKVKIVMVNSMGQKIVDKDFSSHDKFLISTVSLPNGLYFILIHAENTYNSFENSSAKFIVRH